MRAIVYTSRTGFTKRYAELLSEATGVPAWSAKEAAKEVPAHSEIFYMGCLEAGTVKGLDALIERYVIRGVAIVGMNPTGNGDLWTEAKINGGFSGHGARIFLEQGDHQLRMGPAWRTASRTKSFTPCSPSLGRSMARRLMFSLPNPFAPTTISTPSPSISSV
mgnify:CR=1 FL=1